MFLLYRRPAAGSQSRYLRTERRNFRVYDVIIATILDFRHFQYHDQMKIIPTSRATRQSPETNRKLLPVNMMECENVYFMTS